MQDLENPLHFALLKNTEEGNNSALLLIENGNGADLIVKNKEGKAPIHLAFETRNWKMVELLVSKIKVENDVEYKKYLGNVFLFAVQDSEWELARLLLKKGAYANGWKVVDTENTALHFALLDNTREANEIAKLLIENGAYLNLKNKEGKAPIHLAFETRNWKMVELLVSKIKVENDVEYKKFLGNVCLFAVQNREWELARLLLKKGTAYTNWWRGNTQNSTLHFALLANTLEGNQIARLLIEAGASLTMKNKKGKTPIQIAAEYGHWKMVEWIASKIEAKKNVKDEVGLGAAFLAAMRSQQLKMAQLLVEKGANLKVLPLIESQWWNTVDDNREKYIDYLVSQKFNDFQEAYLFFKKINKEYPIAFDKKKMVQILLSGERGWVNYELYLQIRNGENYSKELKEAVNGEIASLLFNGDGVEINSDDLEEWQSEVEDAKLEQNQFKKIVSSVHAYEYLINNNNLFAKELMVRINQRLCGEDAIEIDKNINDKPWLPIAVEYFDAHYGMTTKSCSDVNLIRIYYHQKKLHEKNEIEPKSFSEQFFQQYKDKLIKDEKFLEAIQENPETRLVAIQIKLKKINDSLVEKFEEYNDQIKEGDLNVNVEIDEKLFDDLQKLVGPMASPEKNEIKEVVQHYKDVWYKRLQALEAKKAEKMVGFLCESKFFKDLEARIDGYAKNNKSKQIKLENKITAFGFFRDKLKETHNLADLDVLFKSDFCEKITANTGLGFVKNTFTKKAFEGLKVEFYNKLVDDGPPRNLFVQ